MRIGSPLRVPTPGEQPGDGQQADQRLVGGGQQRAGERAGGMDQRRDLLLGVQVRRDPLGAAREQPPGRHLAAGIEGLQVGRETARDDQPVLVPDRGGAGRQDRPGNGCLDGDGGRPGLLEVADEVQQHRSLPLQLVAQGPAHRQVVLGGLAQRAHSAPASGHGRARARSASISTFA
jgi:hypothetical protein